jgi:peptidoglycan L-alanyl-D-glutamate endopeptidase CwlK
MFKFSARSYSNLVGVDPRLAAISSRALAYSDTDFVIICGMRTIREQEELVRKGASWTMHSKHLNGRAIDFAAYINGGIRWEIKRQSYETIGHAFKRAAAELGVPIVWGGDWSSKDMGHIELA